VAEWIGRFWWSLDPLSPPGSTVFGLVPEWFFLDSPASVVIAVLLVLYPLEQAAFADPVGLDYA
jgi:hypothetical protein